MEAGAGRDPRGARLPARTGAVAAAIAWLAVLAQATVIFRLQADLVALNHDVAWLLLAARRALDGGRYGVDFFEDMGRNDDSFRSRHVLDQSADLMFLIWVETVSRFVKNQHFRIMQYRLRQADDGWVSVPEHHAALWRMALQVEQRPLNVYEEVTQWS